MNKYFIILIVLVCLIPTIVFIAKPDLIGIDSYAYYNSICSGTPLPNTTGELSKIAFNLMPCNQVIIKILLGAILLFNTLILSRLGELFHEKGWITGIIAFLSQAWINWHFLFEDDQLAYSFLFLGLYWMWKGEKTSDNKLKYLGLIAVSIGGMFWKASIYFLLGLIPLLPIAGLLSLIFIIFNFQAFITKITPDLSFTNVETIPFIAFPSIAFLLLGLKKLTINQKFLLQSIYFIVLAGLNANFIVFVIPFLSVATMLWYYERNEKQQKFFKFLVIGMLLGVSLTVYTQMPNQDTWTTLNQGNRLAQTNNKPLNIDWTFRHYAENKDLNFNLISGDLNAEQFKGYVITWKKINCKKILIKNNIGLYEC